MGKMGINPSPLAPPPLPSQIKYQFLYVEKLSALVEQRISKKRITSVNYYNENLPVVLLKRAGHWGSSNANL